MPSSQNTLQWAQSFSCPVVEVHIWSFLFFMLTSRQILKTEEQADSREEQYNNHCSVAKSCLTLSPHELQHSRLPCPSLASGVRSDSCPLSWWCHPTISSSVAPFSSCPQSLSASRSFPVIRIFPSGDQSIGASAFASVLPMNTQGWFPVGLTGFIALLSNSFSRVFSNTTVKKHQLFGTQLSLWFSSHIHTWLLEKP